MLVESSSKADSSLQAKQLPAEGVYPGADPGFWERGGLLNIFTTGGGGGYGRGRAPSRDSKGVLGER